MNSFDLVIRGGRVVTPDGIERIDIGIKEGRIAALGARLEPGAGGRVIDAAGLVVLPGLIDIHVHLRDPGFTHKEDFYSGTSAAAASGITMVVAQPNTRPPIVDAQAFAATRQIGEQRAVVDFGIAAAATESNVAAIPELVAAGAFSIDLALGGSSPATTIADNAALVAILEQVAATGAVATVFAADGQIWTRARTQLQEAGRKHPMAHTDAFTDAVELVAVGRVMGAAIATGARVLLRQVSCGATVQLLRAWRNLVPAGKVMAEVTPHHLYMTRDKVARFGMRAVMGPPLRDLGDNLELQAALKSGIIDIVATDHAPHTAAEKDAATDLGDVWSCPPGVPGVETMLPSLLAAVDRGEMTLSELVAVASERPARIFGLFPRKGAIAVGADADIVVVDEKAAHVINPERFFGKSRISAFDGETLRGKVIITLVRGREVYTGDDEGGRVVAAPGYGRFVAPSHIGGQV